MPVAPHLLSLAACFCVSACALRSEAPREEIPCRTSPSPRVAAEVCTTIEASELLWRIERAPTPDEADGEASFEPWARCVENIGDFDGDGLDDLLVVGAQWFGHAAELLVRGEASVVPPLHSVLNYFVCEETRCIARIGALDGSPSGGFLVGVGIGTGNLGSFGVVWSFDSSRGPHGLKRPFESGAWGDSYARDLADAGDIDGDGVRDVLVASVGPPRSVVLQSGVDGALLEQLPVGALTVRAGRDIDGDRVDDFALAQASSWKPDDDDGSVSLVLRGDRSRIVDVQPIVPHARFGHAIEFVDDLDGDGACELAISAPEADEQRGAVWVISGARRTVLRTWLGDEPGARFGASLSADHDLDGDGVRDLVVGAPGFEQRGSMRSVFVLEPRSGRVLLEIQGGPATGHGSSFPVSDWDKTFLTLPHDYAFGWSIATAQLDRDGLPELVIGAPEYDGSVCKGRLFAVSGAYLRTLFATPR